MNTRLLDRRMNALTIARECALLGARPSTVSLVTGLKRSDFFDLLYRDSGPKKPGVGLTPNSRDWILEKASLLAQLDAAMLLAKFDRLRTLGISYQEALVGSYKQYRAMREEVGDDQSLDDDRPHLRISFDRAFALVRHAYAVWGVDTPTLMLTECPKCRSRYIVPFAASDNGSACPICRLLNRYRYCEPLRASFDNCSRKPVDQTIVNCLASLITLPSARLQVSSG